MGDGRFSVDLEDEVVRGALVVHQGNILPPVVRQAPAPLAPPATPAKGEEKQEKLAITPWKKASREVATVSAGMGSMVGLGKITGAAFMVR
jgi:NAD(P) transhydrogenase